MESRAECPVGHCVLSPWQSHERPHPIPTPNHRRQILPLHIPSNLRVCQKVARPCAPTALVTDIYCRRQGRNDTDDDKRSISLFMAPRRTSSARTIMAVFGVGAAAVSINYCAVCGAANAKATEPKVVPKAGLSEGPSAEQKVQVCDAGRLKNTPVLAPLPVLAYDVLLPLGQAGSRVQMQEPSLCE